MVKRSILYLRELILRLNVQYYNKESLNSSFKIVYQLKKIPETQKVKEGFHHDLNAKSTDELSGPAFPCKVEMNRFTKLDVIH